MADRAASVEKNPYQTHQAAKARAARGRHSIPEGGSNLVSGRAPNIDGLQYSYSVRIMLISLYSLSDIGGGERYTLNTIRAMQAGGDECTAYAIVNPSFHPPYHRRLSTEFVRVVAEEPPK